MKNVVVLLIAVISIGCTEEVIKPVEVERIVTDTLIVVDVDTLIMRDTVIVNDTITVTTPPIIITDTLIIIETDTIVINNTVFQVRPEFMSFVNGFINDANRYGWGEIKKDNLILEFSELNEISHPDHSSISYVYGHQNVAKVHWIVDSQNWLVPIYREMAHLFLGKPYLADDVDDIMNPSFSARNITGAQYDDDKRERYIKQLMQR